MLKWFDIVVELLKRYKRLKEGSTKNYIYCLFYCKPESASRWANYQSVTVSRSSKIGSPGADTVSEVAAQLSPGDGYQLAGMVLLDEN